MDGQVRELSMMQKIVTDDSVTLYWDKPEKLPEGAAYQIVCNGKEAGTTDRTHFTIDGLSAETEYTVEVRLLAGAEKEGRTCTASETLVIKTGRVKRLLDITKAPYSAVGDGQTMNTEAIQRAIDDCTETDAVYFPAGIFMTGALRLHSDMELYLEKDAVLQGTDRPEDYLPRIKSRYE